MSPELAEVPANSPVSVNTGLATQRRDFATRFQPGQSGNPLGRKPGPKLAKFKRLFLKQLNMAVAGETTRGDIVADAIVSKAETGDLPAAVFIRDTVDGIPGKAENQVNLGVAVTIDHVAADSD